MKEFRRPLVVGVVNITTDSFSDGGLYLESAAAIEHAERLLADGADILDLGAASSNPNSAAVAASVEIERLAPVVAHLKARAARISIDTTKPEVQRWALAAGVEFLNDIRGFPDESLYGELASSSVHLIAMHFISDLDKAVRAPKEPAEVWNSICTFFDARVKRLLGAGVSRERIVIDPGMGFFLASNPEPSLLVLGRIGELKERFGLPLMIGVSRKSFLRNIGEPDTCDIQTRTLAAELYAALSGADFVRTHDARALCEGLLTMAAIAAAPGAGVPASAV